MNIATPRTTLMTKFETLERFEQIYDSLERSDSYAHGHNSLKHLINQLDINQLISNPMMMIDLHYILAKRSDLLDVSIKFTVQTNLFYGSVIQFGTDAQRDVILNAKQNSDVIGCFALTEKTAGIASGMFVGTRADYNSNIDMYVINTGSDENRKVWISNGLYANYAVVFASLYVDNVYQHIQPFFIKIREKDMTLKEGIHITNMGDKHSITFLDNVSIRFTDLILGPESLMNRREIKNFNCVADRLLTGRLIAGLTALQACKRGVDKMRVFTEKKSVYCNSMMDTVYLIDLPHIKTIFDDFDVVYSIGTKMIDTCTDELVDCIKKNMRPSKELVEKINCVKIYCAEKARDTVHTVQKNLGSQSLLVCEMNPSAYIPNVIADGDTGMLRQKLVVDSLKCLIIKPFRYISDVYRGKRTVYELLMLIYLILKIYLTSVFTKTQRDVVCIYYFNSVKHVAEIRLRNVISNLTQMF